MLKDSRELGRLSALSMLLYFLVGPYVNIVMYEQCGFTFARRPLCWDSTDGIGNNIASTLYALVTIIFDILFVRAHSNGLIPNV